MHHCDHRKITIRGPSILIAGKQALPGISKLLTGFLSMSESPHETNESKKDGAGSPSPKRRDGALVKKSPTASSQRIKDGFRIRFAECVTRKGSVYALSKAANIPIPTLQRYQKGSEPSLTILVAIAEAANVSVEWLATGSGQMGRKFGVLKYDLNKLRAAIENLVEQTYDTPGKQ